MYNLLLSKFSSIEQLSIISLSQGWKNQFLPVWQKNANTCNSKACCSKPLRLVTTKLSKSSTFLRRPRKNLLPGKLLNHEEDDSCKSLHDLSHDLDGWRQFLWPSQNCWTLSNFCNFSYYLWWFVKYIWC